MSVPVDEGIAARSAVFVVPLGVAATAVGDDDDVDDVDDVSSS